MSYQFHETSREEGLKLSGLDIHEEERECINCLKYADCPYILGREPEADECLDYEE